LRGYLSRRVSTMQLSHEGKLGNKVDVVAKGLSQGRSQGGVIRGLILGIHCVRYDGIYSYLVGCRILVNRGSEWSLYYLYTKAQR
jgi:hypothetical protein